MPKVSVPLGDEVHAAVRVRAFSEGVTLAELGRRFFESYGRGGGDVMERGGTNPVVIGGISGAVAGLGAGEAHEKVGRPVSPDGADAATDAHVSPAPSPRRDPGRNAKCVREARHHINHTGNPCSECGFPIGGKK